MWIKQALQPASDTRDQELNYTNNIKLKNKSQWIINENDNACI